jgi:ATP-dependent protease Clp ATPase subunit
MILEAISNKNYGLARDQTLQINSILNLFILITQKNDIDASSKTSVPAPTRRNSPKKIEKILKICLEAIDNIFSQFTGYPHFSAPTCISSLSELTCVPSQIKMTNSLSREIGFHHIIGSDDAKQILYENVVLPLSISASMRSQVFQGIRSTVGNVLLFGPPGTGTYFLNFVLDL